MNPSEPIKFLPLIFFTPYFFEENKNIPCGVSTTLRCIAMNDNEIKGGELYYNCVPATWDNRYFDCCKIRNNNDILAQKLWSLSQIIVENKGFKLEIE